MVAPEAVAQDGPAHQRDGKQGEQAVRGSFMAESPQAQSKIVVPASQPMVAVLGSGDEFLRVVEKAFPDTDIHVRGNEITVTGQAGDVALVDRLYDEIVTVLRAGQGLTSEAVERLVAMLRTESSERPADVLTLNI